MAIVPAPSKSKELEHTGLCVLVKLITAVCYHTYTDPACTKHPMSLFPFLYSPDMHELPSSTSPPGSLWETNITNVNKKRKITSIAIYLLRLFVEFQGSQQYKQHFTGKESPSSNATEGKFLPFSTMSALTGTTSLMRTALLKLNRAKPARRESKSQNSV